MIDSSVEDSGELRVTSMIAPLRDKLLRQKQSLKRLLSKPKSERNTKMIKKMLKEAKSVRKIIKKYYKQGIEITCPNCGHIHTILQKE